MSGGSKSANEKFKEINKIFVKIIGRLTDIEMKQGENKSENPRDILMMLALRKEGWKDEEIELFRQKRGDE